MLIFPSFFNAGKPTYEIEQSLRFDSTDYTNLSRTPSSAGNRKTWTISFWLKRAKISDTSHYYVSAYASNSDSGNWNITSTTPDEFSVGAYNGEILRTTSKYRDPASWYHVVVVGDTTNATTNDRQRIYVNGERVTASVGLISQNGDLAWNSTGTHYIGRNAFANNYYINAYLAEFHSVDGQALDQYDFGEFDNNGVWRPIEYTGSHGTQGFYLKFDPTATNGIGHDHSGNGNHWTANGFFYEIGTPDYNANWIGSTSGSYYSGSWENVFNGDVTVGSNYVYAYNNTATLTFSTALSGVIEVYGSDGGAGDANSGFIRLSDGSTWSINSIARANAQWHSFGTKSGITTITVSSPGGHGALLGAIRVDGNLLVNNSAKAGYDNFSDTPTTNWCTLNPVGSTAASQCSNGNLQYYNGTTSSWRSGVSSFAVSSGKWYFEAKFTSFPASSAAFVGISRDTVQWVNNVSHFGQSSAVLSYGYYSGNGRIYDSSSSFTYGASYTTNDVIGCALDLDAGTLRFYKNGVDQGQAVSGLTGIWNVGVSSLDTPAIVNFGQRDFEQTPPSGFLPLNTSNLPAPTIKDGSDYFNTKTYTGNGSTQSITGVGFQPDFTWIKQRNGASTHSLQDAVRGAGSSTTLRSDTTNAEDSSGAIYGYLSSFDTDGFSLDAGSDPGVRVNGSGDTYVAWNWLAGGTGSTNTAGSITSTVSANPSAGFSIVGYTGDGTQFATIGHGLGVAPKMIIVKNRSSAVGWAVLHTEAGTTGTTLDGAPEYKMLSLNSTAAASDFGSDCIWNPTSTTFKVAATTNSNWVNQNGSNHIAYCFAEVEGYSKFGSYTGNGSNDGPFVFLGFRPALILTKRTNSTSNWVIQDSTRQTYNPSDAWLRPNTPDAEGTTSPDLDLDFLSNGFKVRNNGTDNNISGSTYIFMALAENPFGGDGVSPATAR